MSPATRRRLTTDPTTTSTVVSRDDDDVEPAVRPSSSPTLSERYFYRHGLFCASYPRLVLVFTIFVFVTTCFPLLTLPIYSLRPQMRTAPFEETPGQKPMAFIQQIIMKAMVHPYKKDFLIMTDAIRGPLASSFKLHLEDLTSFQDLDEKLTMDDVCLRTDGVSPRYSGLNHLLPDYGCLILSPANLWKKDTGIFQMDPNLVSTVYKYQRSKEGYSSMTDLAFGLRPREAGIPNFPLRNRQRLISYAVTIALKENNEKFVGSLKRHLKKIYPINQNLNSSNEVTHIYYPPIKQYYRELAPLLLTIVILFLYVYFSCKKIEVVRSKFGIAITAVVTVGSAICMSLGMSGLSLNIDSKVYYVPYLVAFISLENILVITRSVIDTPIHLDVKIRVGQGLSKEGGSIFKCLVVEMTVLSLGFAMGDLGIREFCVLAVTGLLADFFLQIFFFVTVLSMDLNNTELTDVLRKPKRKMLRTPISGPSIFSSKGHGETDVMAPSSKSPKEPKRVRFLSFWARKRIIMRMFLLTMLVWLSTVIYQASIVETLLKTVMQDPFLGPHVQLPTDHGGQEPDGAGQGHQFSSVIRGALQNQKPNHLKRLQHDPDFNPVKRLPYTHWPMMFGLYNMSLYGRFITVLPPIELSMVISPDAAVNLRNPKEAGLNDHEEVLVSDVDLDSDDYDAEDQEPADFHHLVPTSPGEFTLFLIFCTPSILFLVYLLVTLYRCVCSRNYAEWRSSWTPGSTKDRFQTDIYTQMIQEASLIQVEGHRHEIEHMVSDCSTIVSMCLGGVISVWDSNGEKIAQMDRSRYLDGKRKESPSQNHKMPDFSPTINTNFSMLPEVKQHKEADASPFSYEKFVQYHRSQSETSDVPKEEHGETFDSSVWAVDYSDGIVVLGCSDGRVELWDVTASNFKCFYNDGSGTGITHLKLCGRRIVAAKISGQLDFLEIGPVEGALVCRANSTPIITSGSPGECILRKSFSGPEIWSSDVCLRWLHSIRAHQQPVTCLVVETTGNIVTGSQDHTLKMFRLEDFMSIYTFHGHCGPITSIFIDRADSWSCAGSGSQDGMLCVWDMMTGACVYSIQAHEGGVVSLTHSPSYVISMGTDEKLCVWERFHGHLINTINLSGMPYCPDLVLLTHNLLMTATRSQLVIWDVRLAEPVRRVKLGSSDATHFIKTILNFTGDTVACNYGNHLRFVRFPMLTDKRE